MKPVTPINIDSPLHFIGVGGSGMSPLACLARSLGYKVSGSDSNPGPHTERLTRLGIRVFSGQSQDNLTPGSTVVFSSAIQKNNPERAAASGNDYQLIHRSDLLSYFMGLKKSIAVGGTHGKTTTTCLTGWLLQQLGEQPSMIAGSALNDTQKAYLTGSGNDLVVEADESDGTFLKYQPEISVITNIDKDHLDFYKNWEEILTTFARFAQNASGLVISADQPECLQIYQQFQGKKVSFGFSDSSDIRASHISSESGLTSFLLHAPGLTKPINVRLKLIGRHNVLNALAALSVLWIKHKHLEEACNYLPLFPGIQRRLSVLFHHPSLTLLDDYAHNPGKISACLQAVRSSWLNAKFIVLFQPHRHSRLDTMLTEFASAFSEADLVWVLPVYKAGEPDNPLHTPEWISRKIARHSQVIATPYPGKSAVLSLSKQTDCQKTVILTTGAGDITSLAQSLSRELKQSGESST